MMTAICGATLACSGSSRSFAQANIATIIAVEIVLDPVGLIGIASINGISGVTFSTSLGTSKGMLVGALMLVTHFVAALLCAGWFQSSGTRCLVTALGAGISLGPVSGKVVASTNGMTHGTDIRMLIRALIRGTDF
jgi:hypothetical protein